ncbi:hypothetical protein EJB05_57688, partial [Eragrostis curvula]
MAQLPPRVPTSVHHWPEGGQHGASAWADDFAEFAASRRGAHRRSLSDSVAFVEVAPADGAAGEFDRLDDDQLMSMFPDDAGGALSSAPASDNGGSGSDSDGGDKRAAAAGKLEFDDERNGDAAKETSAQGQAAAAPTELIRDPKRVKRILANRQSAQRSRVRKLQYISELERSVTTLQNEVSVLSPRVAFLDQQRTILTVGNSHLKQRIAALAQDKIFKDAHQEALRKEIERLRQVYEQQNLKMSAGPGASEHGPPPPVRAEKELMS